MLQKATTGYGLILILLGHGTLSLRSFQNYSGQNTGLYYTNTNKRKLKKPLLPMAEFDSGPCWHKMDPMEAVDSKNVNGPGVSLYLLHEDTGHP